ncbi:MAG: hypothetical protein V4662_01555 [Verrucomicrobiota bacterium]
MKPFTLCYCLLVTALSSAIIEGFHSTPPEMGDVPAAYQISPESEEPRHVQGATHEDFLVSVVLAQMAGMRDGHAQWLPNIASADRGGQVRQYAPAQK